MNNEKVAQLLRVVADLITEEKVEKKQEEKVEKTEKEDFGKILVNRLKTEANKNRDNLKRSLDIMKRVDESDKVRAYKHKLSKKDEKLKEALDKIEELREEAFVEFYGDANKEMEGKDSSFVKRVLETQKSAPATSLIELNLKGDDIENN